MEHTVNNLEIVIYFVIACFALIGVATLIAIGYGAAVTSVVALCFVLAVIDYLRSN